MIAKKLLKKQGIEEMEQVQRITNFLISESGSHDYTIYKKEAQEELGLKIEKPDQNQYDLIKEIYKDIATELELTTPYDPIAYLGGAPSKNYSLRRGLVESLAGGCHLFLSEGILAKQIIAVHGDTTETILNDSSSFEGWRKNP